MQIRELELPRELPRGTVLCRVRLSTICGSDLHTISGRRIEPAPSVLGHESVGEIVAIGEDARFWNGDALRIGDRVTWTIMASCGTCDRCARRLPQKCRHIKKYGHLLLSEWPGLTGGYAEYIYLYPGTAIFSVPPELDDTVVAPANCALATVVCGVEAIGGIAEGQSVLIFGAGMLGIYAAALAKVSGAGRILVADTNEDRARIARRFGADETYSGSTDPIALGSWARAVCGIDGVDVALEVCGDPRAATAALDALGVGGRLLVAGTVTPNSTLQLDGNAITRKCLTIRGIHNYHPVHLEKALRFLGATATKFPFAGLVDDVYSMHNINEAFQAARLGCSGRVGLRCMG